MYRLVFDTILAALFWMYCNLRGLNLERLGLVTLILLSNRATVWGFVFFAQAEVTGSRFCQNWCFMSRFIGKVILGQVQSGYQLYESNPT